jgi:hypothetical protein
MLAPPPNRRALFMGMLQVTLSAFGGGLSAWSQSLVLQEVVGFGLGLRLGVRVRVRH